jgi:hypothetical protein
MADEQEGTEEEREPEPGARPPTLSYAGPPGNVKLKTIRRMPAFEANLAAAKLEAAGVPSFVADQNIATAHPLLVSNVRLQVAEEDVDRAEGVLAAPSVLPDDEDDDDDDDEKDTGYVTEAYRCPRCHRMAVDFMPLSPAMRNTRFGCLLVLLLPALVGLVTWLVPRVTAEAAPEITYPPAAVWTWIAVLMVLSLAVVFGKRGKRCRECGHTWSGDAH